MESLLERHASKIKGVVSCFDRLIIQGTLPGICHAKGMTAYLKARNIRIFDYAKWAEELRDQIRTNAEAIAAAHGLKIEFIRKIRGFARRIAFRPSWLSVARTPAWCTSSRLWKPAPPTNHGTTR